MKDFARLAPLLLLLTACATGRARQHESVELTVLTWNILHGANEVGELNLEATGRYISEQAADLVFLQEIDEGCERSGGVDQITLLGRMTGMDAAFGSFMPYQGGRYGLGTLSSLPVGATRSLRLPDGDEPRVALAGGGKPRPYVPTLPEIARAKPFLDLPITSRDQASWSREACPLSSLDTRP